MKWSLQHSVKDSYRMIMHMAVRMRKQIKISHYYWHSSSRYLWFRYASGCNLPGVTVVALLSHLKWHAALVPCGAWQPHGILMLTPNFCYNEIVKCTSVIHQWFKDTDNGMKLPEVNNWMFITDILLYVHWFSCYCQSLAMIVCVICI